ncbi:MAG TPA: putative Ig domain-containing protein [Terriglobales bacterium]|nr:putative Ig domain-containing protein [Terriglobales bacterium]
MLRILAFLLLAAAGTVAATVPTVTLTSPLNGCNTCGPQVTLAATANFAPIQWQVQLDGLLVYSVSSTSTSFSKTITTSLGVWHTITVSAIVGGAVPVAYSAGPIQVYAPAPLVITTTSLPQAYTNIQYSAQFTATGGTRPYTWSLPAGSLPPGLTMAATTGVVSGKATQAGSYSFDVQVTDSLGLKTLVKVGTGFPLAMIVHNSAIKLSWIYTSAVDRFNVYRSTVSGGPYSLLGATAALSYTDKTFVPGKTYYFVVTAVISGAESVHSGEIMAVTK